MVFISMEDLLEVSEYQILAMFLFWVKVSKVFIHLIYFCSFSDIYVLCQIFYS